MSDTATSAAVPEYLTPSEIAAKIKASKQFVYKIIEAGELEADRFGALVRISPAQFDAYRAKQKPRNPEAA